MTVGIDLVELVGRAGSVASSGRPVVLGHGLTLDRRSVHRLGTALADDGHRVLVWELPDHGAAPAPASAWSVEALGAALADALATAPIAPPILVGVSMGGYAALEAVGGPARAAVAALVLIGCSGVPSPPVDAHRVAAVATWARDGVLDDGAASAMAAAELGDDDPGVDALRRHWLADPALGSRFLNGYLALFTRPDPARAAQVAQQRGIPSLVVRGARDPWVTARDACRLAELLGGPCADVPDAAHQPQHTHFAATLRLVRSITSPT